MGPYTLIVVVYSPEKTIGTLVGVPSTLFSSNLKKKEHLFCSILANYPYCHVKDDLNMPIFHFLDHTDYLYTMKYKYLK